MVVKKKETPGMRRKKRKRRREGGQEKKNTVHGIQPLVPNQEEPRGQIPKLPCIVLPLADFSRSTENSAFGQLALFCALLGQFVLFGVIVSITYADCLFVASSTTLLPILYNIPKSP